MLLRVPTAGATGPAWLGCCGPTCSFSTRIDAYAEHRTGDWTTQLIGGVSYSGIDQSRKIAVGSIDRTATSNFDRIGTGVGVRVLRAIATASQWTIAPNAAVSLGFAHQGGYRERGAGSMNLQVDALDNVYVTLDLGVDAWRDWTVGNRTLRPYAGIGLRQQWTLGDDRITQRLDNVGEFSTPTYGNSATLLRAKVGADFAVGARTRAYLNLSTDQGSDTRDYRLMLGVRVNW